MLKITGLRPISQKNNMKKILFLILIFFTTNYTFSQSKKIKEFSKESKAYIDDINTFMLSGSPSEDIKKMMKTFSKKWNKDGFSESQKLQIYEVSNLMLKKRKRVSYFQEYLEAVLAFSGNELFNSEFQNWSSVVSKLINTSSNSRQLKFFVFSGDLFKENILLKNRSLIWSSSSSNYTFKMDSLPVVEFVGPTDLRCIARKDTMIISQTEGYFSPLNGFWNGNNGLINWQRAGYSVAEIYAELSDYKIKMRSTGFSADSVKFYNNLIFDDRFLFGKIEDKLINKSKKDRPTYPKFDSYDKKIVLSDLIDGVDFIGGYSLHGNRFVSTGGDGHLASLVFYRNEERFLIVSSERIALTDERVMASNSSIKLLFDNDSIYHPGLNLLYNTDQRRLDLIRDGSGISLTPYINTYHDMDMDFESLRWNIDDDKLVFGNISNNSSGIASFRSANYFSNKRYDAIAGIDELHPIIRLHNFNKAYAINGKFLIADFLKVSKFSDDQDIRFLMDMSSKGFLVYNSTTGVGYIRDNVERYIKARSEKIDYDVINFISAENSTKHHAELDFKTMDLTIEGVKSVVLSSVRDVICIPYEDRIIVKKGRDFEMKGELIAGAGGRFRINSFDIKFDYEDFKLYFKDASTQIWIPNNRGEYNQKGELKLDRVESEISIKDGELLIDTNTNMSGIWKDDFPEYPIIKSYDRSKVFYDEDDIFGGVYKRDRFYFELDPFEIDSLDSYNRQSLDFPGEFYSADIIPPFFQRLRVQEDNSLGFSIKVKDDGLPLYVDKGKFYAGNRISMDKSGFRGAGTFEYLTSITESDDYIFFPDSMNTYANSFNLTRSLTDGNYPQSSGDTIYEHWVPYNDILTVKKLNEDLNLYNAKATLDGEVYLEPTGLTGAGRVFLENSELFSNMYEFQLNKIYADTADFVLNRSDLDAIAFQSVNLKTEIDLVLRTGTFQSNGVGSYVDFPENQYICYIDELTWFMDQKKINLGTSEGGEGSKFVSMHPDQDSLSFVSGKASYSLEQYVIDAEQVEEIEVADAVIYPADKKVMVRTAAVMNPFVNANIMVNKEQKLHDLYQADVSIYGANDYSGIAKYTYVGRDVPDYEISFDSLFVDEGQTIAYGSISKKSNFLFNPQFSYNGYVTLEGNRKEFYFEGGYKVNHECSLVDSDWIKFEDYVGKDLKLPIGGIVNENGDSLYFGPVVSIDNMYPTFLSELKNTSDQVVLSIKKGYLSYNRNSSKFIISNDNDSTKEAFTMSNSGCVMKGDGLLNLGLNLGRIDLTTHGKFNYNAMSNSFKSKLMLGLEFFMSDKAMEQFGMFMHDDPMPDELEMTESFYTPNFGRIINDKEKVFEYDIYGYFEKLPKELKKSMYFYELTMNWDEKESHFLSQDMLGLGNSYNNQINKYYKGTLELDKDASGDRLNLYMETDMEEWYFFSYADGLMKVASSLEEFNIEVLEVKTSLKELPTKKGQATYEYDITQEEDVDKFKKRFFR